jgi:hypothetical protein
MKDRAAGAAAQLRERGLPLTGSGRHAQRRWPVAAAAAGAVVIGSVLVRRRRRKA